MGSLSVSAPGPQTTFQDLGRPGYAHLGVPRSGAADLVSLRAANRLVGNAESAVCLETTFGGFVARARGQVMLAVTGPATRVQVDGRDVGSHGLHVVRDGQEVRVLAPSTGCRNYLAVRGGFDVPRTLGSSSTDSLSGLGPAPLKAGDLLTVCSDAGLGWPATSFMPPPAVTSGIVELIARAGPREELLSDRAWLSSSFVVNPASNRIGVRLDPPADSGPALTPGSGSIASEGVPLGGVQIPPSGQPVIFLADHPVTGGYPVVAVLTAASVARAAQLVAGDAVRIRVS